MPVFRLLAPCCPHADRANIAMQAIAAKMAKVVSFFMGIVSFL